MNSNSHCSSGKESVLAMFWYMYPYTGQENINSNYLSLHCSREYNHIHWSDFCDVIVTEKKTNKQQQQQQQQQPKMQSRGIDNFYEKFQGYPFKPTKFIANF